MSESREWRVGQRQAESLRLMVLDAQDEVVAFVSVRGNTLELLAEQLADGRLIAAAPALLTALERLTDLVAAENPARLLNPAQHAVWLAEGRAAIASARGRG